MEKRYLYSKSIQDKVWSESMADTMAVYEGRYGECAENYQVSLYRADLNRILIHLFDINFEYRRIMETDRENAAFYEKSGILDSATLVADDPIVSFSDPLYDDQEAFLWEEA